MKRTLICSTAALAAVLLSAPQLEAQTRQGVPYKSYHASLTQTSTNAPTVTVLGANFLGAITWTRSTTGTYVATIASPGTFAAGKVFGVVLPSVAGGRYHVARTAASTVTVYAYDAVADTLKDGMLTASLVEIRIYP